MNPSEGPEESLSIDDILSYFDDDYIEKKLEEESGCPNQEHAYYIQKSSGEESIWPNQDGKSVTGTSIINPTGTGGTKHLISQYQATHDAEPFKSPEATTKLDNMKKKVTKKSRASHAINTSEKRRGIPLDVEEKKKRKKIADKRYRDNCKAYLIKTEEELQSAREKVKDLERAIKSLKKERKSMARKAQKLQSAIKRMKGTIGVQEQQLAALCRNQEQVGKMEEEMQGLMTENFDLKRMNQYLKVEKDTITEQLQKATSSIEKLQLEIDTMKGTITQQEQFIDFYSNGLNNISVEQEQLWQDENGRYGFVGDGYPIATSVSVTQSLDIGMSQQVEKWKREFEETKIDRAETKKQMDEVLAEIRAMKATMSDNMENVSLIVRFINGVFIHNKLKPVQPPCQ